jgi:hypothetical protein
MQMGPVSFCALVALSFPASASAQRNLSLGAGTGLVRSAAGSSFSALTISPAAQWLSPWTYAGASGALSLLERGVWASQGRGDLWMALLRRDPMQFALNASVAGSTRSDALAAGSAAALFETVRGNAALGIGPVFGVIEGEAGVAAVRVRARGWGHAASLPAQLSISVEGTRLLGAWYGDVVGGITLEHPRISPRMVGSFWLSGRLSEASPSSAAASALLQYHVSPTVTLEVAGGNYPRDPFQGLPQAGFIAGGVRVYATPRPLPSVTTPPSSKPLLEPLVAQRRGDTLVVRFRMPGARSVSIAGNWNSWTPDPLRALGDEIWEATLELPPGVYHFNLVVDGTEWVVPGGVATVPDGMGGLLAILNVL